MSYDLYFYKRKNTNLTANEIAEFLKVNLNLKSEISEQWLGENVHTEAYFSFEKDEIENDGESFEIIEEFPDFDNTAFNFNLNYFRPDFFGQYAFEFVDKFVEELNLYVLNPQSLTEPDKPIKPKKNELYENWSKINSRYSAEFSKKHDLNFFPLEKSNEFYNYNKIISKLQEKLGDNYYVPKIYLFKRKLDGKIITISTWTQHIPNVFPAVDYFLLSKKYKKFFKTIEENGLISSEKFYKRFGHLLDDLEFKNCKIICPQNAEKASALFNSTKIEHKLSDFADQIQIEKVVNMKPLE